MCGLTTNVEQDVNLLTKAQLVRHFKGLKLKILQLPRCQGTDRFGISANVKPVFTAKPTASKRKILTGTNTVAETADLPRNSYYLSIVYLPSPEYQLVTLHGSTCHVEFLEPDRIFTVRGC